ncbi:expressed unknown protein [Seminavis robusta]|uniref:G-protein coupled receptors family 2 profile 2 domain-containing protein n=1 Tax=Seminavis robusta TaxID=568900 RepID=A0A9N8EQU3_9STRA|nr:expressed unknown protein [Seminavis robusta]|eukprot:Sro1579_g283690.1 n/a (591) ;mRNA; r:2648-4420
MSGSHSRFTPPFSVSQQRFLAICPKFSSSFSIVGSLYIIQHVLRSPSRRQRVYTRLLLVMSGMDLMYAIKCFLSTWPLPTGSAYGAVGTTQTCTAAAFWGQGGSLSSAVYNGSLTLYYLLTIRYGWTQSQFQQQSSSSSSSSSTHNTSTTTRIRISWEWLLHAIPLSIGWGTAIASLPLRLFNPIGWTCWIGPWPLQCAADGDGTPCERGHNAKLYRWLFFHAILWATFAFVTVAMILIYAKIKADERRSDRYNNSFLIKQEEQRQEFQIQSTHDNQDNQQQQVEVLHEDAQASSMTCTTPTTSQSRLSLARSSHRHIIGSSRVLFGGSAKRPSSDEELNTTEYSCSAPFSRTASFKQRKRKQQQHKKQKLSRRFAEQAFWYILSFFLAWIIPMAQFAVTQAPEGTLYYPLLALTVILNPLQGMWNALIYIRPRYLRYRQKQRQQQQQQRRRQSRNSQEGSQQFLGLSLRRSSRQLLQTAGDDSPVDSTGGTTNHTVRPDVWQAIVSAVSVQGEDDEDEWEGEDDNNEESSIHNNDAKPNGTCGRDTPSSDGDDNDRQGDTANDEEIPKHGGEELGQEDHGVVSSAVHEP